ncbi:hypothetical protein CR513_61871, partial [Mucuna pruriens]
MQLREQFGFESSLALFLALETELIYIIVDKRDVKICKVVTLENVVDCLTKPLLNRSLIRFKNRHRLKIDSMTQLIYTTFHELEIQLKLRFDTQRHKGTCVPRTLSMQNANSCLAGADFGLVSIDTDLSRSRLSTDTNMTESNY